VAAIDDLLEQVGDSALRAQLEAAVSGLRQRTKFGLVYEEHTPETVLLPGAGIRVGSTVMLRKSPTDKNRYLVEEITDGSATLCATEPVKGKKKPQRVSCPLVDLLVVKPFGEPVYPVLVPAGEVPHGGDKPYSAVINGENFHALQLALYAYVGQVDCIYIDPPYNTGARDWKYNNNYVDDNDTYQHSKWLSFMEKRLVLARKLLRKDSVLVVTIDEHEVTRLGVLLSQLFKDADITLVTIVMNTKGVTRAGVPRFSRVEEYAFFCFFGDAGVSSIGDDLLNDAQQDETPEIADEAIEPLDEAGADADSEEPDESTDTAVAATTGPGWRKLLRSGDASRRQDREQMFYPLWIEPKSQKIVRVGERLPLSTSPSYEADEDGLLPVWPIRQNGTEGRWGVGAPTLHTLVEQGFVKVGRYVQTRNTWGVSYLTRQIVADITAGKYSVESRDPITGVATVVTVGVAERRIKTVWFRKRHNAGVGGTALVSKLVGTDRPFSFPKSLYAVRDTLAMLVKDKKEALVMDFFAGSGTTLHATAMLNAEDGGKRRCVLITNNDVDEKTSKALNAAGHYVGDPPFEAEGICKSTTVPRVRAAITGKQALSGEDLVGKYADGTPLSTGYKENAAFFDLSYEDADALDLGARFASVVPALWLASGSIGVLPNVKPDDDWLIPPDSPFAVLLNEDRIRAFLTQLGKRPDITQVWLVTDSETAFARLRERIPGSRRVGMLYRDYLRNFEVNAEVGR